MRRHRSDTQEKEDRKQLGGEAAGDGSIGYEHEEVEDEVVAEEEVEVEEDPSE